MTVYFPTHLPYPTVEGYSIKPDEAIVRTDMEAGPARQRRRFTQTPSKISVRWVMNKEQFSLFEAWYKYYAKEGAEWFFINLLGGLGILEQEARFTKQFEAKLLNGFLWEITSELEIRNRPTLTEDALGILLDSDAEMLFLAQSNFHTLILILYLKILTRKVIQCLICRNGWKPQFPPQKLTRLNFTR